MQIHSMTVVVSSQEAALDFYTSKLGWQVSRDVDVSDTMRFLTVVPPSGGAELALGQSSWFEGQLPPKHTGIAIASQDIDATYAELVERGVRFKGPVETMPWGGKATWFFDLDENEFFLVG